MPKELEDIIIQMKCFTETEEHIANNFSIALDNADYKITFNETETQAVFNKGTKSFNAVLGEEAHSNRTGYLAGAFILMALTTGLYVYKKQKNS